MADLKIRLNDIVSSRQIRSKQRAPIHVLHNSIKRNTINQSAQSNLPYDCKLPQLRFSKKQMSHMLGYLLSKQQLTLPDRNIVRRIILDTFEEDLLSLRSKDFIRHIRLMEKQEGDTVVPEGRHFYMVLKGAVQVTCAMTEYQRSQGQVFGQLQIMSEVTINEIVFLQSSIVLLLQQQHFRTYLLDKYRAKYDNLQRQLDCLHEFLVKVPRICKYTLLSKVDRRVYQLGQKIVGRGENVDRIIVVGDKLKDEQLNYIVKGTIGLYELKKNKSAYQQSIYSPTSNLLLLSIQLHDFHQYVTLQNTQSLMKSSYLFIDKSFANSTAETVNVQGKQKTANFMRVRKVKLISQKRSKTEPRSLPIDNQFKFLKLDCLGADLRCETKLKARSKFINSLAVSWQQKGYLR